METPHLQIIDRDRGKQEVREHFSKQILLLQELVNYGSMLLVRIIETRKNGIDYLVINSILFKHLLSMLDSIEVQVSHGIIFSSYLQARSLLEISLFIEWILKEDTTKRSKYYYVGYYRKEKARILNIINQINSNTKLAQQFEAAKKKRNDVPNDLSLAAKIELDSINEILNKPSFKEITKEFDDIEINLRRPKTVDWFVPTGVWNLREIADKLDLTVKHYLFYNNYSKVMHGTALNEQVTFNDGNIYLKPLRELVGIDTLLTCVISDVIRVFKLIIVKYRPDELTLFTKKYVENWRKSFLKINKVIYK